jgi:hypothetical protein
MSTSFCSVLYASASMPLLSFQAQAQKKSVCVINRVVSSNCTSDFALKPKTPKQNIVTHYATVSAWPTERDPFLCGTYLLAQGSIHLPHSVQLLLQLPNLLCQGLPVDPWGVPDVAGAAGVAQCAQCLHLAGVCRTDTRNKHGATVPTQGVLKEMGQLA